MIVASYRGIVTPVVSARQVSVRHATGGLVNAIRPALDQPEDTTWVCSALLASGEAPHDADLATVTDLNLAFVPVARQLHDKHYARMSNGILWNAFHGTTVHPGIDVESDWAAYVEVNRMFARKIADIAVEGDSVLINDYHLMLCGAELREMRPDLAVGYFHHIPFSVEELAANVPDSVVNEIVTALGSIPSGFQDERWEQGLRAAQSRLAIEPEYASFVRPVAPDHASLIERASSANVAIERRLIRNFAGARKVVARIDRADPMKNIPAGLLAIDTLLEGNPDLALRTVFIHHVVPTRMEVPSYSQHLAELTRTAADLNEKWRQRTGSNPVLWQVSDDYDSAVALMAEYDLLLVNPVREGLNLVALEGPLINTRRGVLVLSDQAGSGSLLDPDPLMIDPSSITQTVQALSRGLRMTEIEREHRHRSVRAKVEALTAEPWIGAVSAIVENRYSSSQSRVPVARMTPRCC